MATYGSLLIDAGGGVIDHGKQSERQPGATVVLGLGGTGADAVIKLKKEVYKQLKPDDVNAVIPKYSDIQYLIIDSDENKVKAFNGKISDIDENTEFFSIANKSIKATFEAKEVLKNRRELDWLDYEHISIRDANYGAGGIRQVGRFLLVDQAEKVYARIMAAMQNSLIGSSGKLTVHICSGLSGGTGSGIFLDICYLVRQALREIGKPETSVCGYFFLPDVNLSVPAINADHLISNYVKVNGFAALQELDYCMNFSRNKDSFKMNYGFKKIEDFQQPVDLCYLISTTDEKGKTLHDGYNYAMGVVTDFIISFLAKVQVPADVETDVSGITLEGHISNLNRIRSGIKLQHGANVDYNILGASVAEMPLSEIATYLGYQLFEAYSDLYEKVPDETERDRFLQVNQLKYENIRSALTKGCLRQPDFPEEMDAKSFKKHGNARFVELADRYLAENKGELVKNSKAFLESKMEGSVPENSTSLLGRTYKGLCEQYVTQTEYGPFFAQRLLYGTQNPNLVHAVDGYIAKNQESLAAELRQTDLLNREYDDALERMKNSNLVNQRGRLNDYRNALNNLYVHHSRVEVLQTMNTVLQGYKQQLIQLNNNFFYILSSVLDTLQKTFQKNGVVLTEGVRTSNPYNWKILSVLDVQKSLDAEVKNLDLQQTLYDWMSMMLENCAKWVNEDENEVTRLISDFILKAFRNATQKTITDYLKEKFAVENITLLAQRIEEEIIMNKLGVDSTPLFWKNSMYHNAVGMNSTLTVPYDSAEIKMAANFYAGKQTEFSVRESCITDKISMMRFYSGLPMYAYQGILELQEKYEKDKEPGRHLFERGALNWNEWLPSPIPASFKIGLPIERIENKNKALLAEFERAEQLGIVKKDSLGNWEIQVTEEFDGQKYQAVIEEYKSKKKTDMKQLNLQLSKLQEEIQRREEGERQAVRIESLKSNEGSERQVMLDFYLESPVLNQLLHKECQKQNTILTIVEELETLKKEGMAQNEEQKNFFNAIFTGVFYYGNTITYTYNEFGIQKTIELQNNAMPLGDTGAYQAFLTFQNLDAEKKKQIVNTTRERMDQEDCLEVKETLERLGANMEKRILQYMNFHDESDPIHSELEEFYQKFMKNLEIFRLTR
ncbi:MAG: hypothetical protein OSJ62_02905 [Lachnospiraceae bacterium]|nr:hypothetical protein [Lachnospiraceae bacterium]